MTDEQEVADWKRPDDLPERLCAALLAFWDDDEPTEADIDDALRRYRLATECALERGHWGDCTSEPHTCSACLLIKMHRQARIVQTALAAADAATPVRARAGLRTPQEWDALYSNALASATHDHAEVSQADIRKDIFARIQQEAIATLVQAVEPDLFWDADDDAPAPAVSSPDDIFDQIVSYDGFQNGNKPYTIGRELWTATTGPKVRYQATVTPDDSPIGYSISVGRISPEPVFAAPVRADVVEALRECVAWTVHAELLHPELGGLIKALYKGQAALDALTATDSAPDAGRAELVGALRPEVLAFAHLMEQQLRANDHKPGWKDDTPTALHRRLLEEAHELATALSLRAMAIDREDEQAAIESHGPFIAKEAADVANFAMMIADVCGALPDVSCPPAPVGVVEALREMLHQLVGEGQLIIGRTGDFYISKHVPSESVMRWQGVLDNAEATSATDRAPEGGAELVGASNEVLKLLRPIQEQLQMHGAPSTMSPILFEGMMRDLGVVLAALAKEGAQS